MDVIWRRLCKYDLRKGDLFVLRLATCDGGVCSILLLPLVVKYIETIDVCISHKFVFMSFVVNVGYVAAVVKDSVF